MKLLLGPLLGHVGPGAALVWARTSPATEREADGLEIVATAEPSGRVSQARLVTRADDGGTGVALVPLAGGPGVLHRVEVRTPGGVLVGDMPVRAAPAPSSEGAVAFAFGSCWLPEPGRRATGAWRVLESLARARHADHLLLLGDQVYADELALEKGTGVRDAGRRTAMDHALALGPDAPLAERVAPYRSLYQQSWRAKVVQRVQARLPTTFAWDDHEIGNGWGSADWHAGARGRALFEAAAQAFGEFQGCRNPEPLVEGSRAHAFRRGPAAFLTLDLRTSRCASRGVLMGQAQRAAVEAFLGGEARESPLLFLAASVPLLHLPVTLSPLRRVSDVLDQWSSRPNEDERAWLLGVLRDYEEGGRRRVVLLGGDAHLATVASLTRGDGRVTWQVTSSPLSQRLPPYVRWALSVLGRDFGVRVGEGRERGRIHDRLAGPNVGVVRGHVRDGRSTLAFELFRPGRKTVRFELT